MNSAEMLLQAALAYARRDWAVIPLRPQDKRPLTQHGLKDASTDEKQIRLWWTRWPTANIGVVTGTVSGLLVVDVDRREASDGADTLYELETRYGALPETVESITGSGGRHIFFRCTQPVRCARLGPGLDIKADGGYIVVPPSIHPNGQPYRWDVARHPDDIPLADPPDWLLRLLTNGHRENPIQTIPHKESIPAGQRNSTLTSLAGSMRRRGMSEEAILAALQTENEHRCCPPLPEKEIIQIARSIARYPPAVLPKDEMLQKDYGHAAVLAVLLRDRYRWAVHRGSWMRWENSVWRPIPEEAMLRESAETLHCYYVALLEQTRDKTEIERLTKRLTEIYIFARMKGVLGFLKGWPGFLTLAHEWDANSWILNVANGTIDLRTGELRPHTPHDLITQIAPFSYESGAVAPRWQIHLDIILPSPAIQRQLQRDLGMALVGMHLDEILPIWYGTGANGKSTTIRVITEILGDYAAMAPPRLLIAPKHERHPTELADLSSRRLVFAAETGQGARMDEERVKMLTGGERIKARYMRGDFFEIKPSWTIVLVTNHKPEIRGNDVGIWRRVRLVPWEVIIPAEVRRPQEEVVTELLQEAPGILKWMIRGLHDWLQDRQWISPEVLVATETYRAEQDILAGFLADCCELGPRFTVSVGDLYETYITWCSESGEEPQGKNVFGKLLRQRGLNQDRRGHNRERYWIGIRLREGNNSQQSTRTNADKFSV